MNLAFGFDVALPSYKSAIAYLSPPSIVIVKRIEAHMKTNKLTLAIALSLSSGAVLAESQPTDTSDIEHVVVSSRVAEPLRELATSVTLITQEEIELRGVVNLADLLRVQPGIAVSNSGGAGAVTSARIRGEEAFRTLVRIDGVDISDPSGTQVQPQLAHLLTNNLARVEILRGVQGMVYGADAGGVINIQNQTTDKAFAANVAAEAGTFDTYNLSANVGGNTDDVNYFFSAADFTSDGFNRRTADSDLQDDDGYDNSTFHGKLGYSFNDNWSVQVVGRHTDGSTEYDGCGFGDSYSHDCISDFEQQNVRGELNYQGDAGQHQLAYAKTLVERESFNTGVTDYFAKGNVERIEYLGQNAISDTGQLVYGVDWEQETVTSSDLTRVQKGYYVEYQDELTNGWFVTAGVRHDDNEDFGEHTSYRVSSAYLLPLGDNTVKFRGAYGTGFRAPSLFEINYNNSFGFSPATDTPLKEEKTSGVEFGAELYTEDGSTFQAIYFNQKVEDGISFDLVSYSGYVQTLGVARSEGIELIADWQVMDTISVIANYTYNDAKDIDDVARLRRPRHLANLGVQYVEGKLSALANVRVSKDAIDVGGIALDDYEVLDLSATYSLSDRLVLNARIENLTDADYQEVTGFNVAGRTFNAGVRYSF